MSQPDKITDILARKDFTVSVEIFPPRNGKSPDIILKKLAKLEGLEPDFISITKGAMGSMRGGTIPIGYMISERYNMNSLVHFRCRDLNKRDVENLLVDHNYFGIRNILAVLGDPIPGEPEVFLSQETHNIYASELVGQISWMNDGQYLPLKVAEKPRDGVMTDFCIGVAAYPEASDMEKELMIMVEKVRQGADFAVTQMVFNATAYFDYVDLLRGRGIDIPVIPGIRPVTTAEHVRAAEEIFSANVPQHLKEGLKGLEPDAARELCMDFSVNLCQQLRDGGAPGVHMFILNDVEVAEEVIVRI